MIIQEVGDAAKLVPVPRVSVLMITYNHEAYLADAIEGVVNQKCSFPFELIIGEDVSTDKTREVALRYQRRYPEIIRVVTYDRNVGMIANSRTIFGLARGEFVAYCEGDDYWCDMAKLEAQVAMMERDEDVGIVHTDWTRSYFKAGRWRHDYNRSVHRNVDAKYLRGRLFQTWYFPKILRTCTVLLRRDTVFEFDSSGVMREGYKFGDSVLAAYVTSRFKVGYVPTVTAVYRVSPKSALRSGAASRVAFYRSALDFDDAARVFFTGKAGYPIGYRWESAIGLLVWGARARDVSAMRQAISDLRRNFGVIGFLKEALKSIKMRLPAAGREDGRIRGDA